MIIRFAFAITVFLTAASTQADWSHPFATPVAPDSLPPKSPSDESGVPVCDDCSDLEFEIAAIKAERDTLAWKLAELRKQIAATKPEPQRLPAGSQARSDSGKQTAPARPDLCCSTGYCKIGAGRPLAALPGCACGCRAAACNCHDSPAARKPASRPVSRKLSTAIKSGSQDHPYICRVQGWDWQGSALGSGTLVHEEDGVGYVLTAKHVIRNAHPDRLMCHFSNGEARWAARHATHPDDDLVVLRIKATGITPATIRNTEPQPGELLYTGGYGGNGVLEFTKGRAAYEWNYENTGSRQLSVDGAEFRMGDSGGPIFDANGNFCGVRWSGDYDGRDVLGCRLVSVRRILRGVVQFATPLQDIVLEPARGNVHGVSNQSAASARVPIPVAAGDRIALPPLLNQQLYMQNCPSCSRGWR